MDPRPTAPALDPDTWVDAHGDHLFRYALARVHNRETAEDLVQQALLAALTALRGFRGRASERTWLTSILKRKVADWLREAVRRNARQEPLPDGPTDALFTRSGAWRKQPGGWPTDDPAREMVGAEFRAVLAGCLGKLPPRLRQAFVLRHLDEAAADEVRRTVGVTAINLAVMLHRARLRVWQCLATNWFGGEPPGS
ncbi:MAG: sigma-70 family RNA polymerase sigma factor [Gemmataceae bacterium]|nr:sigma-70 family RNA polymerase sigma factor [Gemmataceae bacterium]